MWNWKSFLLLGLSPDRFINIFFLKKKRINVKKEGTMNATKIEIFEQSILGAKIEC